MKIFSVCGLIVLVLVVLTKGQTKYCCTLDQFEGVLSTDTKTDVAGVDTLLKNISYVFYDFTNTRRAEFVNETTPSGTSETFVLQLYTDTGGKIYKLDLESRNCSVEATSRPFKRACVPDNAVKMGDIFFGTSDNPLDAEAYLVSLQTDNSDLEIFFTATADQQCAPINEIVTGTFNGVPLMQVSGYVNIRPGISQDSVFNVPPECQGAPEVRAVTQGQRRSASVGDLLSATNSIFHP